MSSDLAAIAARAGCTVEELRIAGEARLGQATHYDAVQAGREFGRVAALPWRPVPSDGELAPLIKALTYGLRTPWGTQVLRPRQAFALSEMLRCRGGFFPMLPGEGKTHLAYLGPTMFNAQRPLLLMPKGLIKETRDKFSVLAQHWLGPDPHGYRIESYEFLSNKAQGVRFDKTTGEIASDEFLERYQPDFIFMDESHKAKDDGSVLHKRLRRYRVRRPHVPFCAATGTPAKEGLANYVAIMEWCIPYGCPAPTPDHYVEYSDWVAALDDKVPERMRAGVLLQFCSDEERAYAHEGLEQELRSARRGFKRRLLSTPGVVGSLGGKFLDVQHTIEPYEPERYDPAIEPLFAKLRTLALTPSDDPVPDGKEEWSTARELALGLHYTWDPPAPLEWRETRKECFQWARRAIRYTHVPGVESWGTLVDAVKAGKINDGGLVGAWLAIEPTFTPNPVPVWHSTEALDAAAAWLGQHPRGVVWCEHTFFGRRLAELTGLPYFAEGGVDARTGTFLLKRDGSPAIEGPCILSRAANGEGRNLQWWRDQLFMTLPQSPLTVEQTIARLHRPGQTSAVRTYVWIGCYELAAGYWQARESAQAIEDREGGAQRILYATAGAKRMPTIDEIRARGGYRWTK